MKVQKYWLALIGLFTLVLGELAAMAQISGTNAVALIEDNVNHATGVMWPIVIGLLSGLVVLTVIFKVGRKGGVRP